MRAFSRWLTARLRSQTMSTRTLAAQVYASKSTVAGVAIGSRPPPLDALTRWMDALAVPEAERQQVVLLAALAHSPLEVEERLLALQAEVAVLRDRVGQLDAVVQQLARPPRRRCAAGGQGRRTPRAPG